MTKPDATRPPQPPATEGRDAAVANEAQASEVGSATASEAGSTTAAPAPGPTDTVTADSVASPPRSGSPTWTRWLPWGLVAVLAVVCLLLGTLYGDAREKISTLEQQRSSATPSQAASATAPAPAQTASGGAPVIQPSPTTGGNSAELLKLAKRDPSDPMAIGKTDAPIVMIEWADFRCPYCGQWYQDVMPQLLPYVKSGSLRIEFRDFVIFGEESAVVHRAAHAAGMQGKFWDFSTQVWSLHQPGQKSHPTITDNTLQELAVKAGVPDIATFNTDRASQAVADAVAADSAQASQLGLKATPFFLVNTTSVPGAYPASTFTTLIEQYGGKR